MELAFLQVSKHAARSQVRGRPHCAVHGPARHHLVCVGSTTFASDQSPHSGIPQGQQGKGKAYLSPSVQRTRPCPCQKAVRAPNRTNVLTNRSAAGNKKTASTWPNANHTYLTYSQRPRPSDCSTHPHPNVRSARSHRSVEAWRTASQKTAEAPSAARAVLFSNAALCPTANTCVYPLTAPTCASLYTARAVTRHCNWKKRQRS
jgi:hypothetical protein